MSIIIPNNTSAVDFDTTLSSSGANGSPDSSLDERLKVVLTRKNSGLSSENVFKPTHTLFWEGKKIVLTHTRHDGAAPQQVGHTQEEWDRIASSIEAMLKKKKETQNDFTFLAARFNPNSGKFEYRKTENEPITSENFCSSTEVGPLARRVGEITSKSVGTPIRYIREDLPKNPPIDGKKKVPPNHPSMQPNPQPAPVEDVPPVDDRWWLKKKWDEFTSRF
jgi:hypothetical protein